MVNLNNISPRARAAWDQLAQSYGDLNITSGYRDPAYNAKVGGARHSQHVHGNAYDVSTAGMDDAARAQLAQAALAAGFNGVGAYDNSMHFDVGNRRFWGPDYHAGSAPDWLRGVMGAAPAQGGHDLMMGGAGNDNLGGSRMDGQQTLGGLLGLPPEDQGTSLAGRFANAFNELRQQPSQMIPQMVEQRTQRRQRNRTADWLEQQPNGAQWAQAIRNGSDAGQVIQAYKAEMAPPPAGFNQVLGSDLGMTGDNAGRMFNVDMGTGKVTAIGGAGTTIHTGDAFPPLNPVTEAGLKNIAKTYITAADAGLEAQAALGQIGALEAALADSSVGHKTGVTKLISDWTGLDFLTAPQQAANAMISQLVPSQRVTGSGTMSDADLQLYKNSLPKLGNSPEGNAIIIAGMRGLATHRAAVGDLASRAMDEGWTRTQYQDAVRALGNPLADVVTQIKALNEAGEGGSPADAPTIAKPAGVVQSTWDQMTPEEKKLFVGG